MNMMLGNLSISQIESRLGIDFTEDIRDFMSKNHEPNASHVTTGKWHCFDIPFNLVCGDIVTATKIYDSIKERADEIKERFQISLSR